MGGLEGNQQGQTIHTAKLPSATLFRRCNDCRMWWPLTAEFFDRDRQKRHGLVYRCKPCMRRYRKTRGAGRAAGWYYDPLKKLTPQYRAKTNAQKRRYHRTPEGRAKYKAKMARRRALVAGASGSHSAADIQHLLLDQGHACAYCQTALDTTYQVDHITPLCAGGGNDVMNLAITCRSCNLRKGTRTVEDFMMMAA